MSPLEPPTVGTVNTGVNRIKRSLNPWMRPTTPLAATSEPTWTPHLVVDGDPDPSGRLTMKDFGYRSFELTELNGGGADDVAYSGVHRVLTAEGVMAFRQVCERLAGRVRDDDYIVSRRLRNTEQLSHFVHNMMRDQRFLRRLSAIAEVPLVPHPVIDGGVVINYFEDFKAPTATLPQVAKWHCDGMTYVFVMQLTDSTAADGGDLMIYQNHREQFTYDEDDVVSRGLSHPDVFRVPFATAGDTVYTRGSHLWHAVTPVKAGRRVSAVLSLFSPLTACDQNSFWHLAAEDGLAQTVRNFRKLRHARAAPTDYCRRFGLDPADLSVRHESVGHELPKGTEGRPPGLVPGSSARVESS
jgi:hypothetical protein